MPHVRYNGPGGVELWLDEDGNPAPPGEDREGVTVEHGRQVEVSAALRDELVARGDEWSEVKAKAAPKEA